MGYDSSKGATKTVLPDIRQLIEHYEGTGEVIPLERFPELARAATEF